MKVNMKTDKQFFGMSQNVVLTGTTLTEQSVLDSHRTFLNDTFSDPNFHTTISIQNIDLETDEGRFEPEGRLQSLVSPSFNPNRDERCIVFTTTQLGHPDIQSKISSGNIVDADATQLRRNIINVSEPRLGEILRSTAANVKSQLPTSMTSKPSAFAVPVPRQQGNRGFFALVVEANYLLRRASRIFRRR